VLQCVAVLHNVLQCVAVNPQDSSEGVSVSGAVEKAEYSTYGCVLQFVAVGCMSRVAQLLS